MMPQQQQKGQNQWNQPPQGHGGAPYQPPMGNMQVRESNPFAPNYQAEKPADGMNEHNDIFGGDNGDGQPKPAFGGPSTGGKTNDAQFDQFLAELDDLKKI